jgi:hypothetical protein
VLIFFCGTDVVTFIFFLFFLSHPDHGHGHLPERRREGALLDGEQLCAGRLQLDLRPAGPGPGHAPRGRAGDDPRAAGGARARGARGAQAVESVPAAGRVGKIPGLKKKTSPVVSFLGFLVFLVFYVFALCPEERVFRVFSVSRILLDASRL